MSLLARIRYGGFARQVVVLSSGTALGQLILVAATPLLTRLYSPLEMGIFGLFGSFLGVASVAVCWRLEMGIVSATSRTEAARLLLLSVLVCIPTSVALGALLAVMIDRDLMSFGLLPSWVVAAGCLALVATGVFGALRYWHVGQQQFRVVSKATVAQAIGRVAASVGLGVAGLGWSGLLFGELLGRLLGITRLWQRARNTLAAELRHGGRHRLRSSLSRAWQYPAVVLPSSLIDAAAAALPLPVIATLFGAPSAGLFALVWRVASVPSALIGASVADVFHAHAVDAHVRGGPELRRLLLRTMMRLAVLATGIYLPLCLLAPWAFGWAFGEQWQASGWLMAVLLPMWWTGAVVSPVSRLLIVVGRPALKLVFDLLYLVPPIAALYLLQERGLPMAMLGYGLAASSAYLVFGALLFRVASAEGLRPRSAVPSAS